MGDGGSNVYAHTVHGAGRLISSGSRWNSVEIDYGLLPTSSCAHDFTPSNYSKSFSFHLKIADKIQFKRFLFVTAVLFLFILALILLLLFLPRHHRHPPPSSDLPLALKRALLFFDAQKSGRITNSLVEFRRSSGLDDGRSEGTNTSLAGGFYDGGSNVKFSFPAAYVVTVLSWTVMEYHEKYESLDELKHIKEIIKWGSDYLLELFVPSGSSSKPALIYSQVGSANRSSNTENDMTCWQRPEDMTYQRPVSTCTTSAIDLSAEISASLAAASMVFSHEEKAYSFALIQASETLFKLATNSTKKETYTMDAACGGEARSYYNSSGYSDELVWAATWLFFATGDEFYLHYATENFEAAVVREELEEGEFGAFYWNNKLAATAVLLTRLRYLLDPGYPYETVLKRCSEMVNTLMCSYLSAPEKFSMTPGGLIMIKPNSSMSLQLASTAAFLAKVYSDYLDRIKVDGGTCDDDQFFSLGMLQGFSTSQVHYILGENPERLSYVVGVGDRFPEKVHHRAASTPWDGKHYGCKEGRRWRDSKDANPNVLLGAMVNGPDKNDRFLDRRDLPEFTEPTIAGNAGLVAALVSLLDLPSGGLDQDGIFANIA